jgi:hypothetical protein
VYPIIRKNFPPQKLLTKDKDAEWTKKCVDAGLTLALYNSDTRLRESKYNMRANYRLYDGVLDQRDIEKTINPWGLDANTFPAKMQCYPIVTNKIAVLIGEESKRKFDWRLRVTNDDAVSEKEKFIKDHMIQELMALAVQGVTDENEAKQKAAAIQRWGKYEAQDLRERIGTQVLNHLYQEQKLKLTFNQGYKDALIAGEEIYCADIIGGKPIMRRVNPLTIYTVGMTSSPYIEDADIIVEDTYHSIGWVIDMFYDTLTPDQVEQIERGNQQRSSGKPLVDYPAANNPFMRYANMPDGSIEIADNNYGNAAYDEEGNIRVTRVVWKSRRKVGDLKYYEENEEQHMIVDENYTVDKTLGQEVKWMWINEWWEGWRVGYDIYLKSQPRPVQFRRMDNLSICGSGYVGTIYNTNSNKARSLMDKAKPYLYMYNTLMYRLEKAIAKYKGPMIELDLAKAPDGWDFDKWIYYGEEMGYLPIDSFKEADKGAATGKLAGNFNTSQKVFNPDMGNYIIHTMELIKYIEDALGKSIGITPQREGSIDNRETVGGVERSVTQSSHSTEEYFLIHDFTKLRALEVLLETAKYAYMNDSKVAQYIMDTDLAQEIYKLDGGQLSEADYGLVMTDSSFQENLRNSMLQLAQAGIQNNKLNFSSFMDIYMSQSIADTRRKIETYEQESLQRDQDNIKAQQDHEAKLAQMNIENREDIQAHQMEIETLKANTTIEVELMKLESSGTPPPETENPLEREKFETDTQLRQQELQESVRQSLIKEQQKDKDLQLKEKALNKPNKVTSNK